MTDRSQPETDGTAALEARLVTDLTPVRRVGAPIWRACLWIAAVAAAAAALAFVNDLDDIRDRLTAMPETWAAIVGSAFTAGLAAVAAFELSLPDRSRLWALAPLPGLALWIGASGMGCARTWLVPGAQVTSFAGTQSCLIFIVGLSVPLSLLMLAMLRRGYSLSPALTGGTAGLAVAAAAATLLDVFHPYDAALDDLIVHVVAVLIVVVVNRLAGGRLLAPASAKG